MARVHNFSAGPAALPTSVLAEIADEMMDYRGCGMSVLEMSHRSSMYQQIINDAEATLRRLLSIPDNYRVLFLQGGATLQFAGIPMNLMRRGRAGYIVTGNFANKAYKEAAKYGEAVLLASSEDTNFDRIPDMADINARIAAEAAGDGLDYVYICQNNTIFGTMYRELPNCGDVPLVADVSSCFLSQPLDVERYGLIYAGAQKNAGAAGVTVVIVRDDLIADGPAFAQTPQYMNLKTQAAKGSMLNTPNTFGIYVCGKVFRWVEQTGGLAAMAERNWAKANLLYDLLEHSELFHGTAQANSRSIANVTFRTGDAELDAGFRAMCSCPVTACAGGTNAVGDAFHYIRDGYAEVMLCGGTEASITPMSIGGFTSMKALTQTEDPDRASIPFDAERSGFVMGEGAAVLMLEEYGHAMARGAKIYAEVVGYGATCDAYHITAPAPNGEGGARAMAQALTDAGASPEQVGYINAHGTSTHLNDAGETAAVKTVFGPHAYQLAMSSTKSMTGHMLGAAGAVEAIFTALSLRDGFLPATIHYQTPDPDCNLDVVPNEGRPADIRYALSNSLGFGGHNGSLLLKKWED